MQLTALAIVALALTTPVMAQETNATVDCANLARMESSRPDSHAIDCTITRSISSELAEPSLLLSDSQLVLPGTLSLIRRTVKLEIPLLD